MRILQLTSDWKWTGPAEPLVHAVTGLRALGHEVDAAFPEPPPGSSSSLAERAREREVVAAYSPARGQGYVPLRDRREVLRLREFLKSRAYDVVHVQHARAHLLAWLAMRSLRPRPKLVASWTHGDPIPRRLWNRWLYGPRGCDVLCVLSERLAADSRSWLGGPSERVAVVPGVVDTDFFAPRPKSPKLMAELGIKEGDVVIGLVARLQPHRQVGLILEALKLALEKAPNLKLLVVGRGTKAKEVLEDPVEKLGLGHAVIRAGYRRDDYRDVLALMDALVFLVPGSDGSCRAVLETMAMGIPTIASRRGILPELIRHNETGLCSDETCDALAEHFQGVASWTEASDSCRRARSTALEFHALRVHSGRLQDVYARR